MRLLNQDLLQEYYDSIQEEYPHLSFKQVEDICSAPFIQMKKAMELDEFPTIRITYFGTFIVYPKRLQGKLKGFQKQYEVGHLPEESYLRIKETFENYLNKVSYDKSKSNPK